MGNGCISSGRSKRRGLGKAREAVGVDMWVIFRDRKTGSFFVYLSFASAPVFWREWLLLHELYHITKLEVFFPLLVLTVLSLEHGCALHIRV